MYGIFTYIWSMFMVNVGKHTIHGCYVFWMVLILLCLLVVWFAHSQFLLASSCHDYIHFNFQMLRLFVNNLSSRWGARRSHWTTAVSDVFPIPRLGNVHHQTWYQARSCKIYSIVCAFLRLAAAEILPSKFTCLLTIIQDKYIYILSYTELLVHQSVHRLLSWGNYPP